MGVIACAISATAAAQPLDTRQSPQRLDTRQPVARVAVERSDTTAESAAAAHNRARSSSPASHSARLQARTGGGSGGGGEGVVVVNRPRTVAYRDEHRGTASDVETPRVAVLERRDRAGDPAPKPAAYLDRARAALAGLAPSVDGLVPAAEAAAERLIQGGALRVEGDAGVRHELTSRPGAIFEWSRPGPGVTLLVGAPEDPAAARWLPQLAERARRRGDLLIAFDAPGIDADYTFSTPSDRESLDAGLAPLRPAVRLALAQAWNVELYAACTRRGAAPVVRLDPELDRKSRWRLRYRGANLHDDRWIDPIAPGVMGLAYLEALDHALADVSGRGWRKVAAAAARVRSAERYGGAVHVHPGPGFAGSALSAAIRRAHQSENLAMSPVVVLAGVSHGAGAAPADALPGAGATQTPGAGTGDFGIAVGLSEPAGALGWGDVGGLHGAELGVAWVCAGRWGSAERMGNRDLAIDAQAPVGDAAVAVPHYRPRLGPVAGITTYLAAGAVLEEAR
ncbi:MAG: hypothetical protein AAF612_00190 [Planctomycetota bacterium]